MIQMHRMAELMDDDVIREISREKYEAPIEIQILLRAATPPGSSLILNANLSIFKRKYRCPV